MLTRLFASALLSLLCVTANAHEYTLGDLQIAHPWSRALPPNVPNAAAYFIVKNNGTSGDRLLSASTPVAAKAELHAHVHIGDVMRMQQIKSVGIPASGEARFEPNGNHVMLFGLKKPLAAGERFPLTLEFEKAGKVDVEVAVQTDAPAPSNSHEGMHH